MDRAKILIINGSPKKEGNTVFLIKAIKLGLDKYGMPQKEEGLHTNFVR